MYRVVIVGGETHLGEITSLAGELIEIVGVAVREDQLSWARESFSCEISADYKKLIGEVSPDIVAISNENDRKSEVVCYALEKGCRVIVDKPICIKMNEQKEIESLLEGKGEVLLMLLTLRGNPLWSGLREIVKGGGIGEVGYIHIRMAVRLKRESRPEWFLDIRRSGGMFLDLLIHGIDQAEWITGKRIVRMTSIMGNVGYPEDIYLRDNAGVFCEFEDGSIGCIEGQRMLPDTKGSDYRATVVGSKGVVDLYMQGNKLILTTPEFADREVEKLPPKRSVVKEWLEGSPIVTQSESLRANYLAILATIADERRDWVMV